MKSRFYWYDALLVCAFIYLVILQLQSIWPFTIDDMFISLRYAKNWSAGYGLLWNVNEAPVEGYTNFSFVVLATWSLMLHLDPVITLKVAGVVGLLSSCIFIFFISRFWLSPRLALFPCIGLLLYKGQILWSVSGLETSVFQALCYAAVFFLMRGLGYQLVPQQRSIHKPAYIIVAGLLLVLAALTRPETPVLIMSYFLLVCWDLKATSSKIIYQSILAFILPFLLLYLPYFIWHWHYYGFLLPNSVRCKGFVNNSLFLDKKYLELIWPFAVLAFYACTKIRDVGYYFLLIPSFVYLLLLLGADPIVAFDNRLFLMAYGLMLPLALIGLHALIRNYFTDMSREALYSLLLLCFGLGFFIPSLTLNQYREFSENPIEGAQLRKQLAYWLTAHFSADSRVVLADAGLIPYYSSLHFIDSYCLNNLAMAHFPKEQMYTKFCQQMAEIKPEVIVLTSLSNAKKTTYTPADQCLQSIFKNSSDYKLAKIFASNNSDYKYRYELFSKL